MRMLVLGGTVYLSYTVAEQALAAGHEVTAACRGVSGEPPAGVRHVKLDRDDPAGWAELAAEGWDAVVDIARKPSRVRRSVEVFAPHVRHWTFVSTGSVYSDGRTPGQRVDTSPLEEPLAPDADEDAIENYGPGKVSCEQAVLAALGDRAFICRAGLIVGPREADETDRFGYWPLRMARGGEVLAPGTPQDAVQVIDVRDLADWIVRAGEQGTVGTYDGVGPVLGMGEFLDQIAVGVGVTPQLTWVDQDFLTAHKVEPWAGDRSLPLWLPLPDYAGFQSRDNSPSVAAGLVTRPLADTARDTLAWEKSVQDTHKLAAGLTDEEERELLTAWHGR